MTNTETTFSDSEYCEYFQTTIELIGRRWTASIVRSMFAGSTRFSEIAQAIPHLSSRLLTERLGELIEAGIVERQVEDRITRYHLTPRGHDLQGVFQAVENWNVRWMTADDAAPAADVAPPITMLR